jgi:spoIIIJ-associated protein
MDEETLKTNEELSSPESEQDVEQFEDDAQDQATSENMSQDSESDSSDENGISEEEMDEIADTAIDYLESIIPYMNVGEVVINEYEGDEGELILDLTGDDLAILIGRHGKTLDALQFLVSSATSRTMGFRYPVVVDVEGYKGRQREKLENIAVNAADRAANENRSVKLRSMTPYERRIIHITLADDPRVTTASEGEGSARRVVVIPQ